MSEITGKSMYVADFSSQTLSNSFMDSTYISSNALSLRSNRTKNPSEHRVFVCECANVRRFNASRSLDVMLILAAAKGYSHSLLIPSLLCTNLSNSPGCSLAKYVKSSRLYRPPPLKSVAGFSDWNPMDFHAGDLIELEGEGWSGNTSSHSSARTRLCDSMCSEYGTCSCRVKQSTFSSKRRGEQSNGSSWRFLEWKNQFKRSIQSSTMALISCHTISTFLRIQDDHIVQLPFVVVVVVVNVSPFRSPPLHEMASSPFIYVCVDFKFLFLCISVQGQRSVDTNVPKQAFMANHYWWSFSAFLSLYLVPHCCIYYYYS